MDPYDFAAAKLPSDTRAAIAGLWEHFAAHADGVDRCFSSGMKDMTTDPTEVMAALGAVSPDLMWEFGPSDRGHALFITPEWRDELRPLARAVLNAAPDLPRWRFHEVRPPTEPDLIADHFAARYQAPLSLSKAKARMAEEGRIDLAVTGAGTREEIVDRASVMTSMLLGEEIERDWLGFIDAETAERPGLLGRLRGAVPAELDMAGFLANLRAEIARATDRMPERPYAARPLDTREITLFSAKEPNPDHSRPDLISLAAPNPTYGNAVFSRARFSSRCHSRHGEWFLYLRIARSPAAPFDDVEDRYALEEELHDILSQGGLGGSVAGSHGTGNVYLDIATTDVGEAVARLERWLTGKPFAADTTLHFLDTGLTGSAVPLAAGTSKPN